MSELVHDIHVEVEGQLLFLVSKLQDVNSGIYASLPAEPSWQLVTLSNLNAPMTSDPAL